MDGQFTSVFGVRNSNAYNVQAIVPTSGDAPDPLVKELLKCQEAEKMLEAAPAEDFPSFESVLQETKAAGDANNKDVSK